MNMVDVTMVSVSLPAFSDIFGVGPSVVVWVILGYSLTLTGLMLSFGRLGDMFGRKRIWGFGLIGHTVGLAFCAFSQTIGQLIFFRVIQAVGIAMQQAMGGALITAAFPAQERGKGLGFWTLSIQLGLITGPALGGFFLDTFGWRSIFYLRLPLVIIATVMAWLVLREDRPLEHHGRFDLWGGVTLFIGLLSLILAINQGQARGWTSLFVFGFGIGGVVLLTLFVIIESRTKEPLLPLDLFRKRLISANLSSLFLAFTAMVAHQFLMPFLLIKAALYSAARAGLLLITIPLMGAVLGPVSGWLSDKIGSRLLTSVGLTIAGLGYFVIGGLGINSTPVQVVLALAVVGFGMGFFGAPNTSSVMGAVPRPRLGTGTSMLNSTRSVAQSMGLALAGVIFSSRLLFHTSQLAQAQLSPELLERTALAMSFHDTILVAIPLCGLAALISALRR